MATFNSFDLAEYGDWLRYRFAITLAGGETLTGYDAWYSDTTSTPDWGDGIDCAKIGQDPTDANSFEIFVYTPSGAVSIGETFEEYEVGSQSTPMSLGGNYWDGAWKSVNSTLAGYDSFEEYPLGENTSLSGGTGFDGSWYLING